jgi:hypothetical protein
MNNASNIPGANKIEPKKPDFLILGAPKAGTTSLADWLSKHPDVFFPHIKEPGFFGYAGQSHNSRQRGIAPYATFWSEYLKLFNDAKPGQMAGEATTYYFHFYQSPGLIKAMLPDAKLVVVLRNPIERIYSHYLMDLGKGYTNLPFQEALKVQENAEIGFGNKRIGCYAENLKRYLSFFPREQIHITLFDDLKNDPVSFYQALCKFLGIRSDFSPEFRKLNDYGHHRFTRLRRMIFNSGYDHPSRKIIRFLLPFSLRTHLHNALDRREPITKPEMSAEIRRDLIAYYRDDILKLQEILDRDLSTWFI